jgi:cyanophycin synthetase
VANGKFYCAVKRGAKHVVGDGMHTVQQLVDIANALENQKAKHRRRKPFLLDDLALELVRGSGYEASSIPAKGGIVPLREVESDQWGGVPESSTHLIHPENISIALRAAEVLRLNVAGIDLITKDISLPWHANGAVINEVNYAPMWTLSIDTAKAGLYAYIRDVFPGEGRIPVDVFIGDDVALVRGLEHKDGLLREGVKCFLCSHRTSYGPDGEMRDTLEGGGLHERCGALLMNRQSDAIVLVIQTDELLHRGLPVEAVRSVHVVNSNLASFTDPPNKAAPGCVTELIALFDCYRKC